MSWCAIGPQHKETAHHETAEHDHTQEASSGWRCCRLGWVAADADAGGNTD
jgi:hypothetical protein